MVLGPYSRLTEYRERPGHMYFNKVLPFSQVILIRQVWELNNLKILLASNIFFIFFQNHPYSALAKKNPQYYQITMKQDKHNADTNTNMPAALDSW